MKHYSSVIFFLWASLLTAQTEIYDRLSFPENLQSPDVLNPRQFLGYRLGERFTEYAKSVAYFEYLADRSPRLRVDRYGSTYEGRPLLLVTATSEENMQRLEDIRATQLALVESWNGAGAQEESLPQDHPVINSYSYNIHGNEASSTEAAMQMAYELATTEDPQTLAALSNTVNLLFVCINPDGRDRYVYWYNGMARATDGQEPRDLEHYAPFPNGRTNHYWFDLNRDWVWGVHPESRGHTRAYQRWMPSVHTDYHEQGYDANYFTTPGTTPRNLLLPDAYESWTDSFGRANIAAFDRQSISYFTRDRFDFFYPSYGSSYPSVMGAIGMLNEQGGIGAGRAVETEDGYVLTLRQRIWDHYSSSIAQLHTAAANRDALIRYSLAAWNPLNSKQQTTAYLIEDNGSPYLNDFIQMMLMNGVRLERTTEPLTATSLSFRDGGDPGERTHAAGSLIIPTEQARHLFINSILTNDLAIEDSVMYDMSTWSAALAYNLEAFSFDRPLQVDTEPVTLLERRGRVTGPEDAPVYAYVIDWSQRNAPQALAKLWEEDVRVRAALEPFTSASGQPFAAGSLIALRGRNLEREDLPQIMESLADDLGLEIHRFTTGRMREGNDLASTRNFPLLQPRVALMVDEPFDTYTSGQIYFLFDWETQLPVTRIRTSVLRQTAVPKFGQRYGYADLFDYDVLILPDARGLNEVFDSNQRKVLLDWITAGGTLVTVGESAEFFTAESDFTSQKLNAPDRDTSEAARFVTYAERSDYYGRKNIPGTALRASLDVTHPLAFGMEPEVYTLKFGSSSLQPDPDLQTVGRYATDSTQVLAAGYAPVEATDQLAGNTWAAMRQIGRGQLVYLLDNPHYRMFWRGPSRLMQNAVMIVPGM